MERPTSACVIIIALLFRIYRNSIHSLFFFNSQLWDIRKKGAAQTFNSTYQVTGFHCSSCIPMYFQFDECHAHVVGWLQVVSCPAGKIGGKIRLVTLHTILDTRSNFHTFRQEFERANRIIAIQKTGNVSYMCIRLLFSPLCGFNYAN